MTTLHAQILKFDEIQWSGGQTLQSFADLPNRTGGRTPAHRAGEPYWMFNANVDRFGDGYSGLRIDNLKLKWNGEERDVAARIEFRDLAVTFENDPQNPVPFDAETALAAHATVVFGSDGQIGMDRNYLWGIKLELMDDFGGTCKVTVDESLVLKGENHQIEPLGLVEAVKMFPQIGMTWVPIEGRTGKRVRAFRGSVWILVNNHLADHPPEHAHAASKNVASAFTDSNQWTSSTPFYARQRDSRYARPWATYGGAPEWAKVFDYCLPNITEETEFVAVSGPSSGPPNYTVDPRFSGPPRRRSYQWPGGSNYSILLLKYPRQGHYDNTHIHADMGDDDNTHDSLVHAPICAENCFHLHWRWGLDNANLANSKWSQNGKPRIFMGWGTRPVSGTWVSNMTPGAVLIPPNQRLTIAITGNRRRPSAFAPIVNATQRLPDLEKAIWYTADSLGYNRGILGYSFGPNEGLPPGEKQIVLEQGIGWAFDYNPAAKRLLKLGIEATVTFVTSLLGLATPEFALFETVLGDLLSQYLEDRITLEMLFHGLYKVIRWYGDPNAAHEWDRWLPPPANQQIPDGRYQTTGPKMEEF